MFRKINQPEFDKFDFEKEHQLPFLIVTPHFVIHPLIKQDKMQIIEALKESLKMLHMWLPWTDEAPTIHDSIALGEQFFTESLNFDAIHYVVYQNEKFMGMCSLSNYDIKSHSARLGYWCRAGAQQAELFVEAVNAIASYTFKNTPLRQLFTPCVVGNFVSEGVAKALNFALTSIELVRDRQIKIFKIDDHTLLPKLDYHWISDDKTDHTNLS
jgi:ribosomal-protein-serine acetyltransferase